MCSSSSLVSRPSPPPVLITCNIQIRRGKTWEVWSHSVMSGRQRVDRRGRCPLKDLEAFCCDVRPRARGQGVHKVAPVLFVVLSARAGRCKLLQSGDSGIFTHHLYVSEASVYAKASELGHYLISVAEPAATTSLNGKVCSEYLSIACTDPVDKQ